MSKTYVQNLVCDESSESRRLFQQEWSLEHVTGLIRQRMQEQGVSRTELASRLDVTLPWVSQLLDGERNKTIRTLSDVFWVLGRALEFRDPPLSEVTNSVPDRWVVTSGYWNETDIGQVNWGLDTEGTHSGEWLTIKR